MIELILFYHDEGLKFRQPHQRDDCQLALDYLSDAHQEGSNDLQPPLLGHHGPCMQRPNTDMSAPAKQAADSEQRHRGPTKGHDAMQCLYRAPRWST